MALDDHAVTSIIHGIFDVNRKLAEIALDVRSIRRELVDEDDDGEEGEEDGRED